MTCRTINPTVGSPRQGWTSGGKMTEEPEGDQRSQPGSSPQHDRTHHWEPSGSQPDMRSGPVAGPHASPAAVPPPDPAADPQAPPGTGSPSTPAASSQPDPMA